MRKAFFSTLTSLFCLCGFLADMIHAVEPAISEIPHEISPPITESTLTQDLQLPSQIPPIRSLKDPGIAVMLSSVFPGLGHVYLDDMKTASTLMGTTACELTVLITPGLKKTTAANFVFHTFGATIFYGVYAAYRDARLYNGLAQYKHPMPVNSLADLTYAPFKWSVIKKPEVWGGVLAALGLASIVTTLAYPRGSAARANCAAVSHLPINALPVGIGEEAYFRGFLQSALVENWGPSPGIAISSILFGAAHYRNADLIRKSDRWRYYTFSMPLIATIGAYCGWLTQKNNSLQESVALHTWYDAILFSLAFLENEASIATPKEFVISIPF